MKRNTLKIINKKVFGQGAFKPDDLKKKFTQLKKKSDSDQIYLSGTLNFVNFLQISWQSNVT